MTYRGGAQWDAAPAAMLYATYSTGWHSGGLFLAPDNHLYRPERISAVTLESKNPFLNDTLQANFEAFYWKYSNQQTGFVTSDSLASAVFATKNVGSSKRKGFDADLQYRLFRNAILGAQAEYLDAEYQRFLYTRPSFLGPTPGARSLTRAVVS